MKITQRLILAGLKLIAIAMTLFGSVGLLYEKLFKTATKNTQINLGILFGLIVVMIIFYKYIMKWLNRKLTASTVADELGVVGTSNFILIRVFRTLEYVLPFIVITYGMKTLAKCKLPADTIFMQIVIYMLAGAAIFLVADYFKIQFLKDTEIRKSMKLDDNKARRKAKINIRKK